MMPLILLGANLKVTIQKQLKIKIQNKKEMIFLLTSKLNGQNIHLILGRDLKYQSEYLHVLKPLKDLIATLNKTTVIENVYQSMTTLQS